MTNILLLNTTHFLPLYTIRALSASEYSISIIGPKNMEAQYSRFCQNYFVCEKDEFLNPSKVLAEKINSICAEFSIDCVIPLDVCTQISVSKMKRTLSCTIFPLAQEKSIRMLDHKWETAQFANKIGVPHPPTEYIHSQQELKSTKFEMPFLIKPTSLTSGLGITTIRSKNDLKTYLKSNSQHKLFPLIIQKEIKGKDVDVSVLAVNGKIVAWTVQLWHELGLLEFIDDAEAVEIAQKIVSKTNYSGLLHIDMRRDEQTNSLVMFECNPRAWGSLNASIYAGVNFIKYGILAAQKKSFTFKKAKPVTYEATWHLVKKLRNNPISIRTISAVSWKDFGMVISDFKPYVFLVWKLVQCKLPVLNAKIPSFNFRGLITKNTYSS